MCGGMGGGGGGEGLDLDPLSNRALRVSPTRPADAMTSAMFAGEAAKACGSGALVAPTSAMICTLLLDLAPPLERSNTSAVDACAC